MANQEIYVRGVNDTEARGPFTVEQLISLVEAVIISPEGLKQFGLAASGPITSPFKPRPQGNLGYARDSTTTPPESGSMARAA